MIKLRNSLLITLFLFMNITFNTSAQDWPELNRFKADNQQVGLPKENEERIVFMGNSITQGWGDHFPEYFDNPNYLNRGIGGQTTPQMLLRFRQDVIKLYPKVVVILAGTNDIAGNTGPSTLEMIEDNLYTMAELAKVHNIEVVLCAVLPVFDYPWQTGLEPAEKIIELNRRVKNYANTHGFVYADYFAPMVDERNGLKDEYTYDGVHPTRAGYEAMAPIADEAIARALMLWENKNK
ncbi:MAG: acylhydrolase [Bacteroidales bacterium]|nr:acylhydrolase [Bacteroidales bacterium]